MQLLLVLCKHILGEGVAWCYYLLRMIFIYVFESFLINSRRLMWSSIGYLETDSVNETLKRSGVRQHVSGERSQHTRAGCWDRERKGLWAEDVAGRSSQVARVVMLVPPSGLLRQLLPTFSRSPYQLPCRFVIAMRSPNEIMKGGSVRVGNTFSWIEGRSRGSAERKRKR